MLKGVKVSHEGTSNDEISRYMPGELKTSNMILACTTSVLSIVPGVVRDVKLDLTYFDEALEWRPLHSLLQADRFQRLVVKKETEDRLISSRSRLSWWQSADLTEFVAPWGDKPGGGSRIRPWTCGLFTSALNPITVEHVQSRVRLQDSFCRQSISLSIS